MQKFLVGLTLGFCFSALLFYEIMPTCRNYTKNGVVWEGYAAKNDLEKRCFYRETRFPWRVWNGQAD